MVPFHLLCCPSHFYQPKRILPFFYFLVASNKKYTIARTHTKRRTDSGSSALPTNADQKLFNWPPLQFSQSVKRLQSLYVQSTFPVFLFSVSSSRLIGTQKLLTSTATLQHIAVNTPLSRSDTTSAPWLRLTGTMQNSQNLVRSEVVETTFNLYSDAEKKASLSVVKIQAHSSLDMNGRAIPG